jgi:hypothetical protein
VASNADNLDAVMPELTHHGADLGGTDIETYNDFTSHFLILVNRIPSCPAPSFTAARPSIIEQ